MKIGVVSVVYRLPGATLGMIESAETSSQNVHYYLYQHSDMPGLELLKQALEKYSTRIHWYDYGHNRGLAKSWNEGIAEAYDDGCDVVLVVNDDVVFGDGALDAMAECAMENRDNFVITVLDTSEFSCFAINPIALETIGWFDENFFPIYWEDIDYLRRASLAGLERMKCLEADVQHGGSSSLKVSDEYERQHHKTFKRNRTYYERKWGGYNGNERYSRPFNHPKFDLMIQFEERDAPYGAEYDRADQDIVKI